MTIQMNFDFKLNESMTMANLLFYTNPLPLSSEVHRQTRLKSEAGRFDFATGTNSVPLAAIEFSGASREYPIVFTGEKEGVMFPAALLGVRHNENLFVTDEGHWDGHNIPVFVRRYPFVLAESRAGEGLGVYIDGSYAGLDAEDGERLFTDEGEATPLLKKTLVSLKKYQGEINRTRVFVEHLKTLDLLTPKMLQVKRVNGKPLVLQGFSVVDEPRLLALGDAQLGELARKGYLSLIYAHLLSLGQVARLSERLNARILAAEASKSGSTTH